MYGDSAPTEGHSRPWHLQVESAEGRPRGPLPHQVFPEDLPRLSPAATLAPGPWLCPQLAPTLRALLMKLMAPGS